MAKKIIATIGVFDGLHRGHQALIGELKEIASKKNLNTMLISFDCNPKSVINPQESDMLLMGLNEKLEALNTLNLDYIKIFNFDYKLATKTAKEFLLLIKEEYDIDTILLGYDHSFGSDRIRDISDLERLGRELDIKFIRSSVEIKEGEHISSSIIKYLIRNNRISEANKLLSYNYRLKGTVVDGLKIGRTMGYPTANIKPNEENKLLPSHGVYAVFVYIDNKKYPAMLYIGRRPTFDDGRSITIEVNIFDMSANLYNKEVEVEFITYTRGDIRFTNSDDLKAQLKKDEAEIRSILYKLS